MTLAATACGSSGSEDPDAGGDTGATTLTAFAAASLTSTFEELATDFEAENEGVEVQFNVAGSSDLVAQLQEGAPADVLATADEATMDKATGDDLVGTSTLVASNTLEVSAPPGNPADVTSVDDLTAGGINLLVCAPEVPCGAAAEARRGGRRPGPLPGQRGTVGDRRPGQGGHRRGRRGSGLRHRRPRGR